MIIVDRIDGIKQISALKHLLFDNNFISSPSDMNQIWNLNLSSISFLGNTVSQIPNIRRYLIGKLLNLSSINGIPVEEQEKVWILWEKVINHF